MSMVSDKLKRLVRAWINTVVRLGMRGDEIGLSAQEVRCDLEIRLEIL